MYCSIKSLMFISVSKKNDIKKISAKSVPAIDFIRVSTLLFLFKTRIVKINKGIVIMPYAAGVCLERNDKHRSIGKNIK